MNRPTLEQIEFLSQHMIEIVLYNDPAETQAIEAMSEEGVTVHFYEYGNYYKKEFRAWDKLSTNEMTKVIMYIDKFHPIRKNKFDESKFTNFSKRNLQVIQNFLLYAGLEEDYSQTAIDYIAEDHVDGEDSDQANREVGLSGELIREAVDMDGTDAEFNIFYSNVTGLIYAVSEDETEYVRLYKLTKPQEVIEVEHRDEILDYCLAKKTPEDEVCIGDIFVHGKYVEQLN